MGIVQNNCCKGILMEVLGVGWIDRGTNKEQREGTISGLQSIPRDSAEKQRHCGHVDSTYNRVKPTSH